MERIRNLQKQLSKKGLSALIISDPHNVRYLSNFAGTNRHLFITPKKAVLITDFRYFRSAKKQLMKGIGVYDRNKGMKVLMGKYRTIGFEDQFITVAQLKDLKKAVPGVKFKPVGDLLEKVRMIKEPSEIRIIKKAVGIMEETLKRFVKTIKIGQSEDEMGWELLSIARELGAEEFSFLPIISFGKETADVHHLKEDRRLKKGEKILIDFGIKYKGYLTDMTRVFYLTQPAKFEHKIYSIVLEANKAAISKIRVGRKFSEIDRAARKIIKDAGYGKYFGHATGHGVGLIIHELPHVSEKSDDTVRPGMVFTIEPGIYIDVVGGAPNHAVQGGASNHAVQGGASNHAVQGGVRIEDMIHISADGKVEVLTKFPKHVTVI